MSRPGTPPETGSVQEISKVATARLRQSPYAEIRNVQCHFGDGVLTLQGQLRSFYQKQLAQAAVANVQGVTTIVNRTRVRAVAS